MKDYAFFSIGADRWWQHVGRAMGFVAPVSKVEESFEAEASEVETEKPQASWLMQGTSTLSWVVKRTGSSVLKLLRWSRDHPVQAGLIYLQMWGSVTEGVVGLHPQNASYGEYFDPDLSSKLPKFWERGASQSLTSEDRWPNGMLGRDLGFNGTHFQTASNHTAEVELSSMGGEIQALPFQVELGIDAMTVFATPSSWGQPVSISVDAFTVSQNLNSSLTLLGGGRLPEWIEFQDSGNLIKGSLKLNNTASPLRMDAYVHQSNNLLFLADDQFGIYVIDITDAEHPQLQSHVSAEWGYNALDLAFNNTDLFVANGQKGWLMMDVSNSKHPAPVFNASLPPASKMVEGIEVYADNVYLAANGLYIYTIRAQTPYLLGASSQPGISWGLVLDFPWAFITETETGAVYSFSVNSSRPQLLDSYEFAAPGVTGLAYEQGLIIASTQTGLVMLNVTQPDRLTYVSKYMFNVSAPVPVHDVTVLNDEILFASRYGSVVKVNYSDPYHPKEIGDIQFQSQQMRLALHKQKGLVVTDRLLPGLHILDEAFALGSIRTWPVRAQRNRVNLDLNLRAVQADGQTANAFFRLNVGDQPPVFRTHTADFNTTVRKALEFAVTVFDPEIDAIHLSVDTADSKLIPRFKVVENALSPQGQYSALNLSITDITFVSQSVICAAANGRGMLVLNVNGPTSIQEVGRFELPYLTQHITSLTSAENLVLISDLMTGPYLIDVSVRHQPRPVAQLGFPLGPQNSVLKDQVAYISSRESGLFLYNISNYNQPSLIYSNHSALGEQIVISGHVGYIAMGEGGGFWIADFSDLRNPIFTTYVDPNESFTYGTLIDDRQYLYVIGDQLQIFDQRDQSAIKLLSRLALYGRAQSAAIYVDASAAKVILFASLGQRGVELIDVTDPAQPEAFSLFNDQEHRNTVHQILFNESTAYIAAGELGLRSISRTFGWYASHHVQAKFVSGDQGHYRLTLVASANGLPAHQVQGLLIPDLAPEVTANYTSAVTCIVGEFCRVDLLDWFEDLDDDPLQISVLLSDGQRLETAAKWLQFDAGHLLLGRPDMESEDLSGSVRAQDPFNKHVSRPFVVHVHASREARRLYEFLRWVNEKRVWLGLVGASILGSAGVIIYKLHRTHFIERYLLIKLALHVMSVSQGYTDSARYPIPSQSEVRRCLRSLLNVYPTIESEMDAALQHEYRDFVGCLSRYIFGQKGQLTAHAEISAVWSLFHLEQVYDKTFDQLEYYLANDLYTHATEWLSYLLNQFSFFLLVSQASTFDIGQYKYHEKERKGLCASDSCCTKGCFPRLIPAKLVVQKLPYRLKLTILRKILRLQRIVDLDQNGEGFFDLSCPKDVQRKRRLLLVKHNLYLAYQFLICVPDNYSVRRAGSELLNDTLNANIFDVFKRFLELRTFSVRAEFFRVLDFRLRTNYHLDYSVSPERLFREFQQVLEQPFYRLTRNERELYTSGSGCQSGFQHWLVHFEDCLRAACGVRRRGSWALHILFLRRLTALLLPRAEQRGQSEQKARAPSAISPAVAQHDTSSDIIRIVKRYALADASGSQLENAKYTRSFFGMKWPLRICFPNGLFCSFGRCCLREPARNRIIRLFAALLLRDSLGLKVDEVSQLLAGGESPSVNRFNSGKFDIESPGHVPLLNRSRRSSTRSLSGSPRFFRHRVNAMLTMGMSDWRCEDQPAADVDERQSPR